MPHATWAMPYSESSYVRAFSHSFTCFRHLYLWNVLPLYVVQIKYARTLLLSFFCVVIIIWTDKIQYVYCPLDKQ